MSIKPYISICLLLIASALASCSSSNTEGDAGGSDTLDEEDTSADLVLDPDANETDTAYDASPVDIIVDVDFGHGIGAPCSSVDDCFDVPGDAICIIDDFFHVGGYCSADCDTDADCGLDAECITVAAEVSCHLSCKFDDDCPRDGYTCFSSGHCLHGSEP